MADAGYSGKPLVDKLGITPGMRVAVLGVEDAAFERQLAARTGDVSRGRVRVGTQAAIYGVTKPVALAKLATLRAAIEPDGMIWVVWPKGRKELTETHVREAALARGLVDVKVCAFSATLSALKLVIPKAQRPPAPRPTKPPEKPPIEARRRARFLTLSSRARCGS